MENEGKLDKVKGAAHNVAGDVKEQLGTRLMPSEIDKRWAENGRPRAAFCFAPYANVQLARPRTYL